MMVRGRAETAAVASTAHIAAQAVLRTLAGGAALATALVAMLSKQDKWGIEASYKLFDGFKFLVAANFIGFAYTLLTTPVVHKLLGKYVLHLSDLVIMNLLMAAAATATAIGYIAMKGNTTTGWYQACRLYDEYCKKITVALAFAFVAVVCFLLICALSWRPYRDRAVQPKDQNQMLQSTGSFQV